MAKRLKIVRVQAIDSITKLPKEDVDVLTSSAAVLFPDGESIEEKWLNGEFHGEPGEDGKAATIRVGETITGKPGSKAIVENMGTNSAAVLRIVIPEGEKGEDGTSIHILGRFDTYEELVAMYPDGSDLDGGFLVGPELGPCNYYVWDIVRHHWTSMGPIKGEKGETGDDGLDGEDGHGMAVFDTVESYIELIQRYPDGSVCNGLGVVTLDTKEYWFWNVRELKWKSLGQYIGPSGPQGERGPAGTITIKQVNSVDPKTPASVINEGTAYEAQLVFNIPRGERAEMATDILVSGQLVQKDPFDPTVDSLKVVSGQIDISNYNYDFYIFHFQYRSTSDNYMRDKTVWISKDQLLNFDAYNNQFRPETGKTSWYNGYVLGGKIGSIEHPSVAYHYLNGIFKYAFNAVHGKYYLLGYKCSSIKESGDITGSTGTEDVKLIYLTFHHSTSDIQMVECIQGGSTTAPTCRTNINGKRFTGWTTTQGSTTVNYNANSVITPTTSMNLYPVYVDETYTVRWYNGSTIVHAVTCKYNHAVTMPSTSKSGYTFDGWSKNNSSSSAQYSVGTAYSVTSDTNFYAVFSLIPARTYTVKLYKYGTLVKTLTSPSTTSTATVNLPTWEADEGEEFAGWTTVNGGTSVSSTNSITINSDTNLYAVFKYTHYEKEYTSTGTTTEASSKNGASFTIKDAVPNTSWNGTETFNEPIAGGMTDSGTTPITYQPRITNINGTSDNEGKIFISTNGATTGAWQTGIFHEYHAKWTLQIHYYKLVASEERYRSSK